MKCSFCGREFHIDQAEIACRSCPIAKGCHLVRCPYCGYEMPTESRMVARLRRLRRHFKGKSNGNGYIHLEDVGAIAPLSEMHPGQRGEITDLSMQDSRMVQKLVAMNLLPGEEICLVRRSPSFVFESGFSQFAVDEEIAKLIQVRLDPAQELIA